MKDKFKYLIIVILLVTIVTSFKLINPRTVYTVILDDASEVQKTINFKTKEGYKVVSLVSYINGYNTHSDFILIMEK